MNTLFKITFSPFQYPIMIPGLINFQPKTKTFSVNIVICNTNLPLVIKFILGTLYSLSIINITEQFIYELLIVMVHMRLTKNRYSVEYQSLNNLLQNYGVPKYLLDIVALLPPKGEQKIGVLYINFITSAALDAEYNSIINAGFNTLSQKMINLINLFESKNKSDFIIAYTNQLENPYKVISITTIFELEVKDGQAFSLANNTLAVSETPTLGVCLCMIYCIHCPFVDEFKSILQMLSLNFETGPVDHKYLMLILNDCLKWYFQGNSVMISKPKPETPGQSNQQPQGPKQGPPKGGKPPKGPTTPKTQPSDSSKQSNSQKAQPSAKPEESSNKINTSKQVSKNKALGFVKFLSDLNSKLKPLMILSYQSKLINYISKNIKNIDLSKKSQNTLTTNNLKFKI
jgi:hypothetical protein